ncbi:MAG: GTPase, partial [Eudoraea sp.]
NSCDCDAVVIGTPIDLSRIINIRKPSTRVFYDLQSIGKPSLEEVVEEFLIKHNIETGIEEMVE